MAKWEDRYNDLKSGKIDKEIVDLEGKVKEGKTTKEEYDKLNRLKKSVENKDKIEKVVEYKEKVEKFLESIDEELNVRKQLSKLYKQQNALENELHKIQDKYDDIKGKMKGLDKSSEQYKTLQEELQKCVGDIDKNNEKFAKQQESLGEFAGRESKFEGRKNSDLRKVALEASSSISKCGIAIENLLDGKNWDAIEYSLSKFKEPTQYTPSKESADKINMRKIIPVKAIEEKATKPESPIKSSEDNLDIITDPDKYKANIETLEAKAAKREETKVDNGKKGNIFQRLISKIKQRIFMNRQKKLPNRGPDKTTDAYKDFIKEQEKIVKEAEAKREEEAKRAVEIVEEKDVKEEDLKLDIDFLDRIKVIVEEPDKETKYQEYLDKKYENPSKDTGARGTSKGYKDFVKSQEDEGSR